MMHFEHHAGSVDVALNEVDADSISALAAHLEMLPPGCLLFFNAVIQDRLRAQGPAVAAKTQLARDPSYIRRLHPSISAISVSQVYKLSEVVLCLPQDAPDLSSLVFSVAFSICSKPPAELASGPEGLIVVRACVDLLSLIELQPAFSPADRAQAASLRKHFRLSQPSPSPSPSHSHGNGNGGTHSYAHMQQQPQPQPQPQSQSQSQSQSQPQPQSQSQSQPQPQPSSAQGSSTLRLSRNGDGEIPEFIPASARLGSWGAASDAAAAAAASADAAMRQRRKQPLQPRREAPPLPPAFVPSSPAGQPTAQPAAATGAGTGASLSSSSHSGAANSSTAAAGTSSVAPASPSTGASGAAGAAGSGGDGSGSAASATPFGSTVSLAGPGGSGSNSSHSYSLSASTIDAPDVFADPVSADGAGAGAGQSRSLDPGDATPRYSFTDDRDGGSDDDDDDPTRPTSAEPNDHNHRVRNWLKSLRLHKYFRLFERMTYNQMVRLTAADLERLGIAARGARTKMLKSIEMLRLRNDSRNESLAQIEMSMDNAPLRKALLGLSEMMQMPSPDDEPTQSNLVFGNTYFSVVHKAYALLAMMYSSGTITVKDDLEFFSQLTDLCIRSNLFSVEHKTRLFSWKSDVQKMLDQFVGWERMRADSMGATRPMPPMPLMHNPQMKMMGQPPPPPMPQNPKSRRTFSETRRPGPPPARPMTQKPRLPDPRLLIQMGLMPPGAMMLAPPDPGPDARARGGSFGSNHQSIYAGGPPVRTGSSEEVSWDKIYSRRSSTGNVVVPPQIAQSLAQQGPGYTASSQSINSSSSGVSDSWPLVYGMPQMREHAHAHTHVPLRSHLGHQDHRREEVPGEDFGPEEQQLMESLCLSVTDHSHHDIGKRSTAMF